MLPRAIFPRTLQMPSPLRWGIFALLCLALASSLAAPLSAQQHPQHVLVHRQDKTYRGQALAMDSDHLILLRSDGRLTQLSRKQIAKMETLDQSFRPAKSDEMRQALQKEFGSRYQVSMTAHFVVVHPPGDHQRWATPFETLYQRFRNYFSSRGWNPEEPEFPLVAVVLDSREEFDRFLAKQSDLGGNVLGYYNPKSNRIITYQVGSGLDDNQQEQLNTLVHEAAHQSAFNTGIHSRYVPTPRWLSEGLAILFEAPGVNNSSYYSQQSDRIQPRQLQFLRDPQQRHRFQGKLAEMITDDRWFDSDPQAAYAMAWGMTFFLTETKPREYFQLLQAAAKRQAFQGYSERERAVDFMKQIDRNPSDLEKRMWQYLEKLPLK